MIVFNVIKLQKIEKKTIDNKNDDDEYIHRIVFRITLHFVIWLLLMFSRKCHVRHIWMCEMDWPILCITILGMKFELGICEVCKTENENEYIYSVRET